MKIFPISIGIFLFFNYSTFPNIVNSSHINLCYNYNSSIFFPWRISPGHELPHFSFYIPCVQNAAWHEWFSFHICIYISTPLDFFFFQMNISQASDLIFWNNFFILSLIAWLFSVTSGKFFFPVRKILLPRKWCLRRLCRTYEGKATCYTFSSTLVFISGLCLYKIEACAKNRVVLSLGKARWGKTRRPSFKTRKITRNPQTTKEWHFVIVHRY